MSSVKIIRNILGCGIALSLVNACSFNGGQDGKGTTIWDFSDRGETEATLATVAYSQGDFAKAEEHVTNSLRDNPQQPQALLVGALTYEQMGRPNAARKYYEDLIVLNGSETSVLGSKGNVPEKMSDIARKRLRLINVKQSELVVEDENGAKVFNITDETAARQSKSAIAEALTVSSAKKAAKQNAAAQPADIKAVEALFSDKEQNMISRFLIMKELAEKDLITKEEFLVGRMSNIGALLPLTNTGPAYGVDAPVPSPDLVIERINVLKEAVEARAISPREFSAERDIIIEALLPPAPRKRLKNKAPAKDIMNAAKDLRKLEVLYDLNLITSKEKAKEQQAIEKYLGINRETKAAAAPAPAPVEIREEVKEVIAEMPTNLPQSPEPQAEEETAQPQPLIPNVSSPF